MNSYRRILLIAPNDMRRSPAMRQATRLAQETGAALHMLFTDYSAAMDLVGRLHGEHAAPLHDAFLRERRDWLATEAAGLGDTGITVTTEAVWTRRAAEEIIVHAIEGKADIVVKDMAVHDAGHRSSLKPIDWTLLRRCPAPLLMVDSDHTSGGRVIAAIDVFAGVSDELNAKIVQHALALAYARNAELHLAYAFQISAPLAASMPTILTAATGDIYESLYSVHHESFETFAAAYGVPPERQHFLNGPPAFALAALVEHHGSDVLVIGMTHRGRFERVLMGSNAEAILDHLHCNVLAIKPDGLVEMLAGQVQDRTLLDY